MQHRLVRTIRRSRALSVLVVVATGAGIAACSDSSTGTQTQPPLVDDRLVAFVSDSGSCCGGSSIYVMHADGSHTIRLTQDHHDDTPAWSPDGSTIAFYSERGPVGIWAINADGSNLRLLVAATDFNYAGEPAFSPNGHSLAFSSSETDSLGNFVGIIEVADADGSHRHQLITHAINSASPSWSPDGSTILFEAGPVNPHLYTIKVDGSDEHQISDGVDFAPAWSPDGRQIAFARLDTNNYNIVSKIMVQNADGSNRRALTKSGVNRNPSWSPDGRQIAYEGYERDSSAGTATSPLRVYRMNASGADQRLMSADSIAPFPSFRSWAPAWKPTP